SSPLLFTSRRRHTRSKHDWISDVCSSDLEAYNAPYEPSDIETFNDVETAISTETPQRIGEVFAEVPEGFTIHKKLRALLEKRKEMSLSGGIDWGFAELIAFGSLL